MTSHPVHISRLLSKEEHADLRRRAVLDLGKLDPQAGDRQSISPVVLSISEDSWHSLARIAERLNDELLACERELLSRPRLLSQLALPRRIRTLLQSTPAEHTAQNVRVTRFDFHPTDEGWRVSEANTDVPGGYLEASGLPKLLSRAQSPDAADPSLRLAQAFAQRLKPGSLVAFVHATAFSDDRQVMMYLSRRFEHLGLRTTLIAPHQLTSEGNTLRVKSNWCNEPAAGVLRFFPCEWLANYPRIQPISQFFLSTPAVLCNPGHAIVSQSKCWLRLLDELNTPTPTWRAFAPETGRPTRSLRRDTAWVLKPALGRVGEDVLIAGVTPAKIARGIRRSAAWRPEHWVAQRRFRSLPLDSPLGPLHLCLGVFVIDGQASGIYARVASLPIINAESQDAALVIQPSAPACAQHQALAGVSS